MSEPNLQAELAELIKEKQDEAVTKALMETLHYIEQMGGVDWRLNIMNYIFAKIKSLRTV